MVRMLSQMHYPVPPETALASQACTPMSVMFEATGASYVVVVFVILRVTLSTEGLSSSLSGLVFGFKYRRLVQTAFSKLRRLTKSTGW